MIEFKGDCGHTIRARDEDAGRVVRCSYCGREAMVAPEVRDDLGALFGEVEETGVADPQATQVGHKAHRAARSAARRVAAGKSPTIDPVNIAMKMTIAAAILICIVVAWKLGVPWVREVINRNQPVRAQLPDASAPPAAMVAPAQPAPANKSRRGLTNALLNPQQSGAYVSSIPTRSAVYQLAGSADTEDILRRPNANKNLRTNCALRIQPGKHTVAVALRVDNPWLMSLEGYAALRADIEAFDIHASEKHRMLNEFFLPDGSRLSVEQIRGARHLVRTYDVEVYTRSWLPITALFVPRTLPLGRQVSLLPSPSYKFDEAYVTAELNFYGIPAQDRRLIIDVLKRIGKVCYPNQEDSRYRVFQIGLIDGALSSVVHEG